MLIDNYGRKIDYMRISVTDMCNFRCSYCMPDTPEDFMAKSENLLSFDDLFKIVKSGIDLGVRKIRITGGEPTLRDGLAGFIKMIRDYKDDIEITLTTNGFFLKNIAQKLKDAGLNRINISLDSLNRERFALITKKDALLEVLAGIDKSLEVGLRIKINCVPLPNINEDELIDILEYGIKKNIRVRFIEYMENSYADNIKRVDSSKIIENISKKYKIDSIEDNIFGPATLYKLENGYRFGIIEPHKDDFCKKCNRIRVMADGKIVPCLYHEDALDPKEALKDENLIKESIIKVVNNRPEKNRWDYSDSQISSRAFFQTGG